MSKVELDPELGRAVAAELKKLGVKGPLIRAAEQGYITELACAMPTCHCPEELGGRTHFERITSDWSDWRSDWIPTHETSRLRRETVAAERQTTRSSRTASAIGSTTRSPRAVPTRAT